MKLTITPAVERTNYLWLIAVLLLITSYVLLRSPNGSLIRDYISFAASIASLVLAVVAIFYSIISSQSLSGSIASLQDSAAAVGEQSSRLEETTGRFSATADQLLDEIKQVPQAVRKDFVEFGGKVESLMSATIKAEPRGTAQDLQAGPQAPKVIATTLALYVIAQGLKTGKVIDCKKITDSDEFRNLLFGFLSAVRQFCPMDLQVESAGYNFQVVSKGEFDPDELIATVDKSTTEMLVKMRKQIDAFFKIPPAENEEKPEPGEGAEVDSGSDDGQEIVEDGEP